MYYNQQRAIEKTKEYEKHKQVYDNVMNFYKVGQILLFEVPLGCRWKEKATPLLGIGETGFLM